MKHLRKIISLFVLVSFITSLIVTSPIGDRPAGAQVLPVPGTLVTLSAGFQPPVLLGLKIHTENPLLFDFIVDQGAADLSPDELKSETEKLVKYFLSALTIPDKESWVNLSPSEKDRIIPDVLGQTLMGKTMLEQDYLLKQLASSLTNPEEKLGQEFWSKVRAQAGNENVETSTLSKVWIVPSKAEVLESNGIVLVGEKKLKVMMDEEYKNRLSSDPSSEVFRSTILPKIDKEVNEGKNFADVRQIYNSVILAAWYKKALKDSLLGKVYADKGKVAGVETDDKEMKQRIYEQYLAAFQKGVYNLIKEETDTVTGEAIPRKYFSGGLTIVPEEVSVKKVASAAVEAELSKTNSTISIATVQGTETQEKGAVQAKASASSGVNRQAQIQKEINFQKAVMAYKNERLQRAYQTIVWWAQQDGVYKPFMLMDDLDKTIALTRDLRGEDPQVIKEFMSLVSVLINYAMKNTSGDRARAGALLANNYNKFSMFYDLLFNEELTKPVGTSGIPSRVVSAKFHSDLVIKADAVLTDAQKAQFVARYQSVYPDLTDFYTLEAWAQKQDNIKTGSGRIWNYLTLFTNEKIAEAQALNAQEINAALASNAARWKAERMRVNLAADELLLMMENLSPAMQGISYADMSVFHTLLREVIYEGYYIYLQDENVEAVMDRALDISVMKNLTTLKIPGRSSITLQEVKQYLERLGFEPNGRPGEALVEPLSRTLTKLAASSALREEAFVKAVGGISDKVLAKFLNADELAQVPDAVRVFLSFLIQDAVEEQEPWYERTTFLGGASGYRLTTGLLASRLYEQTPEVFNKIGITKTVAADGSSVLRLSEKFVQEIERQGGAVPGILKRLKIKDTIFSVEAKRLAYMILSSPNPQATIDEMDDFLDIVATDLDKLPPESIDIDVIRDAISAFRSVEPEIGTAWLSAFENLEKAYHSDGVLLLLEFVEFWAAVQDAIVNDRSPFASKEDALNAIDLARAILNAPDVEKAAADFEAFTLDYLNGEYLNSERGEMFEAMAKIDVIGPALQTSLEKLAADQDFEIAKNYFGHILGMTEGLISTASSGVYRFDKIETNLDQVRYTVGQYMATAKLIIKNGQDFYFALALVADAVRDHSPETARLLIEAMQEDMDKWESFDEKAAATKSVTKSILNILGQDALILPTDRWEDQKQKQDALKLVAGTRSAETYLTQFYNHLRTATALQTLTPQEAKFIAMTVLAKNNVKWQIKQMMEWWEGRPLIRSGDVQEFVAIQNDPAQMQVARDVLRTMGLEGTFFNADGSAKVLADPDKQQMLKTIAASSALETETAINNVVGDIEKMLEETKDFKEESESDLARLSRAGRESYAAFRLRRAQWPVDLKAVREDVESYKGSQRGDLLAGVLRTAEDLANEIRAFWEVKDKPQSWSYWTGGRDVRAGRDELMSTGKEIGRYEFLSALRHGLITQGDIVIVNVNDDAPAGLRRPQRFGVIEKIVAPGLIELWGANKANLDLGGVITFENDPASGFTLRDVVSVTLVSSASSGVRLKDYLISKLSSKTFFTVHALSSVATDRMKAVWAELNEYPDVVDTKYRAVYGGDVRIDFLGTVKVGAEEMVLTRFLGLKRNELDSEAARTLVGPFYVRGNRLDTVLLNFESFENLPDKVTVTASSGVVLAKAENIKIADSKGIHSRPAVELVKLKEKFPQFDIFVSYKARLDIRKVKLEGFLRMLGLQIPQTTVTVELELAEGYEDSPDIRAKSKEVLKALQEILLTDFSGSDRSPFAASSSVNNDQQEYGGIDFDPTNMNLQIKRDGKGVPLPLPQQNLEQINIEGLFPVIINIVPVNRQTLPVFLGRADAALPLGRS